MDGPHRTTSYLESLAALTAPALTPWFEQPSRAGVVSGWYGHLPFAAWLVGALQPSLLVELGTHAGVSYAAFCDAVVRHGLPTRCFAVDTWKGDEHAAFYGEDVFTEFSAFHDARYAGFSTMLRSTFDAALTGFADGSVDLLHIDGRHFYDDVRHDYEAWRPKLSQRAVVLFHDTEVRDRDFGVWRLWDELAPSAPHFGFTHGHGLGVLATGPDVAPAIAALCAAEGTPDGELIRNRAATLGARWIADYDLIRFGEDRQRAEVTAETLAASLRAESLALANELTFARAEIDALLIRAGQGEAHIAAIESSTVWRASRPLRQIATQVPEIAQAGRTAFRLARVVAGKRTAS